MQHRLVVNNKREPLLTLVFFKGIGSVIYLLME